MSALPSISVVGNLAGRYGISVAAQKHVELLRPLCRHVQLCEGPHVEYDIVYHHTAPPVIPPAWYAGRRVIGYWVVESSEAAPQFKATADALAQIWTCSEASAQAIRALGTKTPVHVIPHPVPVPDVVPDRMGRDTVTTLIAFAPGWLRKNPEGSIRAWQRAFEGDSNARLIIKTRLAGAAAVDCLKVMTQGDSRVEIINGDMPDLAPLYARADIFLSLHHAGAFELHCAEAAAHGLPVVATKVGGVMDYLSFASAFLIDGKQVPCEMDDALNRRGHWIDPFENDAVDVLRRLAADSAVRLAVGQIARQNVHGLLNESRITQLMADAMAELPAEPKTEPVRKAVTLLHPSVMPIRPGLERIGDARRAPYPPPVIISHRRSGTHLLGEMITRSWQTPWLKTHHFPDALPRANAPVYVLRNPIDCLHSTWRWWQDGAQNNDIARIVQGMSFADWLAGKAGPALGFRSWRTRPTDSLEVGRGCMYDPIKYWLHHWQEAEAAGIPVVLYEDLIGPGVSTHVTETLAKVMQRDAMSPLAVISEGVGITPSDVHEPGKALAAWPKAALNRLSAMLKPDMFHGINRTSLKDWLDQ